MFAQSRPLDPAKHIAVTCSATEGLYAACQAVLQPGDCCVVFEPMFPWYLPAIRLAGARPLVLRLRAPGFQLPLEDLARLLQADLRGEFDDTPPSESNAQSSSASSSSLSPRPRIKMVMVNTPHNPSGVLLTRAALEELGRVVTATHPNCVLLSDEAYEAQVFPSQSSSSTSSSPTTESQEAPAHVRLSLLPGMAERTLTLGTASKMFSLTGWRVGWVISHNEQLLAATRAIHAYATFCAPTPLQLGVAAALEHESQPVSINTSVISSSSESSESAEAAAGGHGRFTAALFARNAATMARSLRAQGLAVTPAQGGYFLVADITATGLDDATFCRQLVKHARVGCIPLSVFYDELPPSDASSDTKTHLSNHREPVPTNFVRFSICKTAELIDEACARIDAVQLCFDAFKL